MVEMLLLGLATLFIIVGICEFIYLLRLLFYVPKVKTPCYSFLILRKKFAIKQLNFIWQKIKWQGDDFAIGIIAVVDDLDFDELSCCQEFIKDKNIFLCSSKSLVDF